MNPSAKPDRPIHWPSAFQFGCSVVALAFLASGAWLLWIIGFSAVFASNWASLEPLSPLLMAVSFFGIALLLVPSAYYALLRLLNKPAPNMGAFLRRSRPVLWMWAFPWVILIGFLASKSAITSILILPIFHLFGVGLPIGWVVYLATRNLPLGSPQRMWGVLGSGLALAPLLISILEGIAVVIWLALGAIYISTQPVLMTKLMNLVETAQYAPPAPEEIIQIFGPYLLKAEFILAALALGAVIVPLIEEAVKPIGVWLLVGRPLSARAGFAAGALSGAGFAFSESLLLTSNGADWASLVVVRLGTGAIHVFTTALMGWALAVAWKRGQYFRLGAAYICAVVIHGLWNGLTILTVFDQLSRMQNQGVEPSPLNGATLMSPLALFLLAVGALVLLVLFNHRLSASRRAVGASDSSLTTEATTADSEVNSGEKML